MSYRSIAATFLIWLAVCPFALGAAQANAPPNGGRFPDDVERAMLFDAWQMRRLHPVPEESTITQGSLTVTPRRRVPERPGWPFRTNGEIFSRPCFDKSSVYFGNCDGVFYCLDKKSGSVRWRKERLERVDSAPALHDGTVLFSALNDTLYALNCTSGEVKWKASFPGIGYRSSRILNKIAYIAGEKQLLGLDPSNGKVLRRYAFSGEGGDFSRNSNAIVVAVSTDTESNDYTGKGSVVCFADDVAEPRWTTALGGAGSGTLACDENNCYLGARDGFFYAIRMADGKVIWRIDCRRLFSGRESEDEHVKTAFGNRTSPVWADGHVIDLGTRIVFSVSHQLINASSVMVLADKTTGKVVWAVRHPTEIDGHFLAADGILVAIAEDRKMLVVNVADGKSVSFSPLPEVLGEGFFSDRSRGEFAGVFLDEGELFIAGADAHVWRLPFASIRGALDWPIATPPKRIRAT